MRLFFEKEFENLCRKIVIVFLFFVMLFLFINSLLHTTGMEVVKEGEGVHNIVQTIPEGIETVIYYNDSLVLNLVFLAGCCFMLVLWCKNHSDKSLIKQLIFIFVWTVLLGTIWVYSSKVAPSEDSGTVMNAANAFAHGDFSNLELPYFSYFIYQLNSVFFNEMLIRFIRLFYDLPNMLLLEEINVIFLAITYCFIILTNYRIFHNKKICLITTGILGCSLQPILSSVFLYGIIPGFMFATIALYYELRYLQENRFLHAGISVVCIGMAVLSKTNYLIFFVAMLCIGAGTFFRRKKYIRDVIYLILLAFMALSVNKIVVHIYEQRSGIEMGQSIPYISFIDMGLKESGNAPGWYNYYPTGFNFEDHGKDTKEAAKSSVESIKNRISYFIKNPQYSNDFFYKKAVSQWNETSYQSIWNNQVRYQYGEKRGIAVWVCNAGEKMTKWYMDIYTQFIFAMVLIGIIYCNKEKNIFCVIYPVAILGGFFYHLLSEAKSQYSLPYFICMTGFAAYGAWYAVEYIEKRFQRQLRWMKKTTDRFFVLGSEEKKIQKNDTEIEKTEILEQGGSNEENSI